MDEGIAYPILLGNKNKIHSIINDYQLDLSEAIIIDPREENEPPHLNDYVEKFYQKRQRRGITLNESESILRNRLIYYGTMMVNQGHADALISGLTRNYSDTIRPALEIIGTHEKYSKVSSMYMMLTKKGPIFFADTTIIPNPTSQELANIAIIASDFMRINFNIEPVVAMLSYSNFGTSDDEESRKVRKAVEILKNEKVDFTVDGEIQANFALETKNLNETFPFSDLLDKSVNLLIFPTLSSANICYKIVQSLGGVEAIGPIIIGLKKPVHILQMGSSIREIINMITIATIDSQNKILLDSDR